jgi:dihydropteroate synthase
MIRLAEQRRTAVMGVVNVTPDSFSDGGLWWEPAAAIAHGLELHEQGADLLEVGGESTRPGAERPSLQEETRRVLPVVGALVAAGCTVSVDTMRASVASAALAAGAVMVNDVSGGLADPQMLPLVAEHAVPYVCMHWRGPSATMQQRATYTNVVEEVRAELAARIQAVFAAGVEPGNLVVDPGLGFAKTSEQNWTLLNRLDRFLDLGQPLLLAASRKAFLGKLLADERTGAPRPARRRDHASAALSAIGAHAGVWCVRVHDVASSYDAVRVAARLAAG